MDERTQESRRLWDALAPGWQRHRRTVFEQQRKISDRLIEAVDARDGDVILELTAGPGETGLALAQAAPNAKVIVSDFAPGMVRAAEGEAKTRGLSNVECRLIDAQAIDLPDGSVGGVLSRYGLMLVPDIAKAFSEMRRVLQHGRSVAYAVWGPLQTNPWMMLMGAAFIQRGLFTPPEGGVLLPLTTVDENRSMLSDAGFDSVDVEMVDNVMRFDSFDHYWDVNSSVGGPIALIAQGLPPDEIVSIRQMVEGYAEPFRTGPGLAIPAQTIFARAS